MTTRELASALLVAVVAIVAVGVYVVSQDHPARDVWVKHPTSQPGPPVPQGGAR